MKILSFDAPAKTFGEALPIGNGRLGAMVYGGTAQEIIQLNQDSIWYGAPIDRVNPEAKDHREEVRGLILDGEITKAEELLRFTFSGTPQSQRPYQPLGNVEISYYSTAKDVTDYQRRLLLEEGMVEELFACRALSSGTVLHKSYLASYPAGVLAVHMQAEEGVLSFDALLRRSRYYDHAGKLDDKTIYLDGSQGEGGVAFLLAMRAETTGGSVRVLGEHLIIRDASAVTLYISCETSFYEKNYAKEVQRKLDQASRQGYAAIKKEHVADYQSLYKRMDFRLSGENEEYRYAENYFQYGRYLMISGSRPGSLPTNLQGIWNDRMTPPWDSKFTININTEMNYWPAEICNLSECHLPLFDHLKRMHKNGCRVAEEMYGCRGFVAHHNTDLWGDCAPQDISLSSTYWVLGGAWLCTHIWTHYLHTQDVAFLQEMYPVLKDAVLFFCDFLIEKDGKRIVCPSISPENTYITSRGEKGCACAGASMDNQILRDLFHAFIQASDILKTEDDTVREAKKILAQIPGLQVGKYGQIMEWMEDYEEAEPGHRHISHLYALHPSHQISVERTPELAKAAAKTLERRLTYGGGHTGWSCAWIVNMYARLGDGANALKNLRKLWAESTFPNLMDGHPYGGGAVFQIDGNFGATAAIAEMILQAEEDRVTLLPALPAEWPEGRMSGLVIPGGATVSLAWSKGTVTECCITAAKPYQGMFRYHGMEKAIRLAEGQTICLI